MTVQPTLTAPMMTVFSRAAFAPEPVVRNNSAGQKPGHSTGQQAANTDLPHKTATGQQAASIPLLLRRTARHGGTCRKGGIAR